MDELENKIKELEKKIAELEASNIKITRALYAANIILEKSK